MAVVPFRVDLSNPVAPAVTIDGRDVSHLVDRVVVEAVPKSLPMVHLSIHGDPGAVAEGIGDVVAWRPDDQPTAREWLDTIDAAELERAILQRHAPGLTVGQIALAILKERADGG